MAGPIGLARPLARLPRPLALALLGATLLACIWSALALRAAGDGQASPALSGLAAPPPAVGTGDVALYRAINARVAAGEDYYVAATAEQRRRGYPVRPFVTVRSPVLAWGAALWGEGGWRVIAFVLWAANALAWSRVAGVRTIAAERIAAGGIAALGGAVAFIPLVAVSHEALAGLLLSLALALSKRWPPAAIVLATLAAALRELALPFVAVLGLVALAARDRRGAAMAGAALALLLAGIALHAAAVAAASVPGDPVSSGWDGLAGPLLPLAALVATSPLVMLPPLVAGPLAVLPLLGWLGLGGRVGAAAVLWFAGWIAVTAVLARPDNYYWMAFVWPAYGVGLAWLPRAVRDLAGPRRRAFPISQP